MSKKDLLDRARTSRTRPAFWFFGYGFVWVSYISLEIESTAAFSSAGHDPATSALGRIALHASLGITFLLLSLFWRTIVPLGYNRAILVGGACLVSVGSMLTGLAGAGAAGTFGTIVGFSLAGAGIAVLGLSWGELYGAIGTRLTSVSVAGSVIMGVCLSFIVMSVGYAIPWVVVPVLVLLPVLSLIWLARAWRVWSPQSSLPTTSDLTFRLPSQVIGGLFAYGIAFGLMLRLAGEFAPTLGEDPASYAGILGAAFVAILMLAGILLAPRDLDLNLTYHFVLPLLIAGVLLLLVSFDERSIANIFAIAGYMYFTMFTVILYADITYRLSAPALAVFSLGAGSSTMGVVAGVLLFSPIADRVSLTVLGGVVVFLIVVAAAALNEWSVKNLWGRTRSAGRDIEAQCQAVGDAHGLTPREQQVLVLLAKGRNAEYIKDNLVLSVFTVRTHIRNIYEKLGTHSHQEIIDMVENYQNSSTSASDAVGLRKKARTAKR